MTAARPQPPARRRVDSSVLVSVGYDRLRLVLEIELVNGHVYQYLDVPEEVHTALIEAPSLGAFFNREIRDRYPTRKL